MITKEHLEHWLGEIEWQLNGIIKEIGKDKLKQQTGITITVSPDPKEDVFVSFEYLQEKAGTARKLLDTVRWDINHDEQS